MRVCFVPPFFAPQPSGTWFRTVQTIMLAAFMLLPLLFVSGCGCKQDAQDDTAMAETADVTAAAVSNMVSNQSVPTNAEVLKSGTATIKVDRSQLNALHDLFCPIEIYVNRVKLGSVPRSGVGTFHFSPRSTGTNTLHMIALPLIESKSKSESEDIKFQSYSGTITRVVPGFDKIDHMAADLSQVKEASLVIERKPSKHESWNFKTNDKLVDVVLNDVKIGTLSNGQRSIFDFEPKEGENTLQVTYNSEVSPVTRFQATANSTTGFVTRWEPDGSGYNIALRPSNESENTTKSAASVSVAKVDYDKQLQVDVIEKYKPLRVSAGTSMNFTRSVKWFTGVTLIDKKTTNWRTGIDIGAGISVPGLEAGIKSLNLGGGQTNEHISVNQRRKEIQTTQSLRITGTGKYETLYWRENYRTGTAYIKSKNGVLVPIRFKEPESVWLCNE